MGINHDRRQGRENKAGDVCQVPQHMLLSDEIGTWAADIAKAKLPDQSPVDYVRVYLTMNVYTDPRLLDVAVAVERLPDVPLDAGNRTDGETTAKATGSDADTVQASFWLPLPAEPSSKFLSIAGNTPQPTVELPK